QGDGGRAARLRYAGVARRRGLRRHRASRASAGAQGRRGGGTFGRSGQHPFFRPGNGRPAVTAHEGGTTMQRRQLLKSTAAFSAATVLSAPAIAQAPKKISFLTWNLVHLEAQIKGWIQGFTSTRPGVEVEWIDKK